MRTAPAICNDRGLYWEHPVPAGGHIAAVGAKGNDGWALTREGLLLHASPAGLGAVRVHPYDPTRKTRLHIGHVIDKSMGGSDEPANLRAICSVCNEGASNVMLPRPDLQRLLVQVRRATAADQRALLAWLQTKFKA